MKSQIFRKFAKFDLPSWLMIISVLITSIGKGMVIPFFALYLVQILHFNIAQAGLIIASRTLGQRGFSLIGGPLVDWLGPKLVIIFGLILMGSSYLFIAFADDLYEIVICTLILGLGGALYTPAIKTAVVQDKNYEEKIFMFSFLNTVLNIGSVIGPLIGTTIFIISPTMLFISTAITFFVLAILTQILLKIPFTKITSSIQIENIYNLVRNPFVLKLMAFMMIFYMLFIQLELSFPIFASIIFHYDAVSLIFLINALIIIFFQIPASTYIMKNSLNKIFLVGMNTLAIGFMLTIFANYSILIFFLAIIIFSFGEIFILTKLDSELSEKISKNVVGTAFGLLGVASALGATMGGILGGNFFNFFLENENIDYYWVILAVLTLALMLLSIFLTSRKRISVVPTSST